MKKSHSVYCQPGSGAPLYLAAEDGYSVLETEDGQHRYRVEGGVPDFTAAEEKDEAYSAGTPFLHRLRTALEQGISQRQMARLLGDVAPAAGQRVLQLGLRETQALRLLHQRQQRAEYWGLDEDGAVVRQCQRGLRRTGLHARLARGTFTALPYRQAVFDMVLLWGPVPKGEDTAAVVGEMLRVAQPGALLVLLGHTADVGARLRRQGEEPPTPPPDAPEAAPLPAWLPEDAQNPTVQLLPEKGLYAFGFRKLVAYGSDPKVLKSL